jgi:hypothetical protein
MIPPQFKAYHLPLPSMTSHIAEGCEIARTPISQFLQNANPTDHVTGGNKTYVIVGRVSGSTCPLLASGGSCRVAHGLRLVCFIWSRQRGIAHVSIFRGELNLSTRMALRLSRRIRGAFGDPGVFIFYTISYGYDAGGEKLHLRGARYTTAQTEIGHVHLGRIDR